jgi:hypothetical protein
LPDIYEVISKFYRIKIRNIKLFTGDFSKIPDFAGILSSIFSPDSDAYIQILFE